MRFLDWGTPLDAIGQQLDWIPFGVTKGRVIGVVEDFHLCTSREQIEPVVIFTHPYHS